MRLFKLIAVFAVAFLLSLVVVLTFMQEPFQQAVPARLVFYQTPAIPIYIYLLVAFSAGLFIGLGAAAALGIGLTLALRRKDKELQQLRDQLNDTQRAVRIASSAAAGQAATPSRPEARYQDE